MATMNHLFTFEPARSGKVDPDGVVPIVAENDQVAIERFSVLWRESKARFDLALLKNASGGVIWTSAQVPHG